MATVLHRAAIAVVLLSAAACSGAPVAPRGSGDDMVTAAQRSAIQTLIEAPDSALGLTEPERADLHLLYGRDDYRPLWHDETGRPNHAAQEALAVVNHAGDDGLDPSDYHQELLDHQSARLAPEPAGATWTLIDVALSSAMLRYFRHVHLGRVDPRTIGFQLSARLEAHDFVWLLQTALDGDRVAETAAGLRPPLAQYRLLQGMLARYRTDGGDPRQIRQIELALERLRWLPDLGDQRLIVLNIPMFRLWTWDDVPASGAPLFAMDAIVGRALDRQTPVFVEEMREVIFRPYWNVPSSILRDEVLPAIQANRDYLRREDMEIVSGDGDDARHMEPTPANLAALRQGALRVRQRPGPKNALGLIKFDFPNKEGVYMHGTPAQALFAEKRRDFSHGCVRVEDPVKLAAWALRDLPEWTEDAVRSATKGTTTIRVRLPHPIRVILFYTTAAVMEDGTIRFADDIYGHDVTLDRALRTRQAGY